MQINFYPESDNNPDYEPAAKEYAKIWEDNEKLFTNALEKYSGLKFKTKLINAVIFAGGDYSRPLRFNYSHEEYYKRSVLMHELCHRLLVDNNIKISYGETASEEVHKVVYLFLYDAWVEALGQEIAEKARVKEISWNHAPHVNAWNFAMSFSKDERQKELEKMKLKYQKR